MICYYIAWLQVKLQETENDRFMDGGETGPCRRLYLREMVARFGHHLALHWNLGEENTQTTAQLQNMASALHALDPYGKLIAVHNRSPRSEQQLESLLGPLLGNMSDLTGASIQCDWDDTHRDVGEWVARSAAAGTEWVVTNDEQGVAGDGILPDSGWPSRARMHDYGAQVLWGTFMAGGSGVEAYFGGQHPHADQDCEDWRTREMWWRHSRIALDFFKRFVPFWAMGPCDELLVRPSSSFCFCSPGSVYVIYHTQAMSETSALRLGTNDGLPVRVHIRWFDALAGGEMVNGVVVGVRRDSLRYGAAPSRAGIHWVAVVIPELPPTAAPTAAPTAPTGAPTTAPTAPTVAPFIAPTQVPSTTPTSIPTRPSKLPTSSPTFAREPGRFVRLQLRGCCEFARDNDLPRWMNVPTAGSTSACKEACEMATAFRCLAIEWSSSTKSCILWTEAAIGITQDADGPSDCGNARCFGFVVIASPSVAPSDAGATATTIWHPSRTHVMVTFTTTASQSHQQQSEPHPVSVFTELQPSGCCRSVNEAHGTPYTVEVGTQRLCERACGLRGTAECQGYEFYDQSGQFQSLKFSVFVTVPSACSSPQHANVIAARRGQLLIHRGVSNRFIMCRNMRAPRRCRGVSPHIWHLRMPLHPAHSHPRRHDRRPVSADRGAYHRAHNCDPKPKLKPTPDGSAVAIDRGNKPAKLVPDTGGGYDRRARRWAEHQGHWPTDAAVTDPVPHSAGSKHEPVGNRRWHVAASHNTRTGGR